MSGHTNARSLRAAEVVHDEYEPTSPTKGDPLVQPARADVDAWYPVRPLCVSNGTKGEDDEQSAIEKAEKKDHESHDPIAKAPAEAMQTPGTRVTMANAALTGHSPNVAVVYIGAVPRTNVST